SPEKFILSERAALKRFQALTQFIDSNEFKPGSRCLEIGCGVGSFLRLMRGAGWHTQGIEPDPNYAKAGEDAYNLSIQSALYEKTSFAPDSFALIASFHVLEHVPSPKTFLHKTYQELHTDGLLFLEVPCIDRPYGGNLPRFFWSAHLYSYSFHTLTGYLQQAGFTVEWHTFTGDFLQIIVRKTKPQPITFPLDDPDELYQRTHRLYRWYEAQQRSTITRVVGKASRGIQHSLQMIQTEPAEFTAGVQRFIRRFQVEEAGPRLARLPLPRIGTKYLTHFGTHVPGNAGDTLLLQAVRDVFDHVQGTNRWRREPLWDEVTPQVVQRLNEDARGIVIGGGGLLLRDTNPNPLSGWQWHCATAQMKAIKTPIVVFAIGYNRFRGQEDFAPVFRESISQLVAQSAFFSLRNWGSIHALRDYLEPDLHEKIQYQPCPTTVLRYFYPAYESVPFNGKTPRLALNIAFDRHRLRF
ncbi:MAG: class I SAM-dependent methyltransferase, partial [Anaerolineales bacterium]|nr:class I SAM-dependent methyltransferase [Anaerolineales bacterium]